MTALVVALARCVSTRDPVLSRVCSDGLVHNLLPSPLRRLLDAAHVLPPAAFGGVRRATLGLFDHIALRTAYIDGALAAVVGESSRSAMNQVVILGAGFDTRAYRLSCLQACRVFEVDHQDTQAVKRARCTGWPPTAASLSFVSCDFERLELPRVLQRAGFDAHAPSVWIWEGVTMYLTQSSVHETLAAIAAMSAPGSTLISTYATPQLSRGGSRWGRFGAALLHGASEPIRYVCTAEQYREMLAAHRFTLLHSAAPEALAGPLGIALPRVRIGMPDEVITIARRAQA